MINCFCSTRVPASRSRILLMPVACLLLTLCSLLSGACLAAGERETAPKHIRTNFDVSERNAALEQVIRESNLFAVLDAFIDRNFKNVDHLTYHFANEPEQFAMHEKEITLAWRTLRKIYLGILDKHPHQPEVQLAIFLQTVEFMVWREFGRYLISSEDLLLSGEETLILDQFALVALQSIEQIDSSYRLDAVESFLLATHAMPLLKKELFRSETEYDEYRYRQVVCLIIGADYEPVESVVSGSNWDKAQQEQCRNIYQNAISRWRTTLAPMLKPDNLIQHWRVRNNSQLQ